MSVTASFRDCQRWVGRILDFAGKRVGIRKCVDFLRIAVEMLMVGGENKKRMKKSGGRRKKEEGRRKKEEGRRKKEEGRRKKEEGRRKREVGTYKTKPRGSPPGSFYSARSIDFQHVSAIVRLRFSASEKDQLVTACNFSVLITRESVPMSTTAAIPRGCSTRPCAPSW